MSYPLFDKDEHWHKPEQAFLTDDHRTILRLAAIAKFAMAKVRRGLTSFCPAAVGSR